MAVQAIKQLHPDIVASIQSKTLFSKDEETLLGKVSSVSSLNTDWTWFPLRLENLEKWEGIFQSEKSPGIFEQTEKVQENHTKYWKIVVGISEKYYLLFFSDI